MNTNTYQKMMREFANFANAAERMPGQYDYARSGGSARNGNAEQKATTRQTTLPIDAWTTEDAFVIQAYVPGINPDEVEVTMEGEELTVRGRFPAFEGERQYLRRELFHGAFERRLTISVPVNVEAISAEYSNGVLTLTVPKAEEVKPKQIKVVAK